MYLELLIIVVTSSFLNSTELIIGQDYRIQNKAIIIIYTTIIMILVFSSKTLGDKVKLGFKLLIYLIKNK